MPSKATGPTEGYPLLLDAEACPPDDESAIVVPCSVCHTRMQASEKQIGQTLTCPDCGAATVVVRPAAVPRRQTARSPDEIGDYPLANEVAHAPGELPASQQTFIALLCPVCHTRFHATVDQVGQSLICPDCGSRAVVPAAPPPRMTIQPATVGDAGYAVEPTVSAPPLAPSQEFNESDDDQGGVADLPSDEGRPTLPRWPLLQGTFSFPFSPGGRWYAIGLALWAAAGIWAFQLTQACGEPIDLVCAITAVCLLVVTVAIGILWFSFASAVALAILRDTANGCDRIFDHPGFHVFRWLVDAIYVVNALAASMLPGAALGWLLTRLESPVAGVAPLGAFFLFPVVLLSMLNNGTPFGAVSGDVFRMLRVAARGWASFYLMAAGLLLTTGAIIWAALDFAPAMQMLLFGAVVPIAWVIYFRLLGRLAWYSADRLAKLEAEGEPDESLSPDESSEESGDPALLPSTPMIPETFCFCPRCASRVEIGRVPLGSPLTCGACGADFILDRSRKTASGRGRAGQGP